MVASKKGGGGSASDGNDHGDGDGNKIQPTTKECCMCGDFGISELLFRCKICKFRLQHEYCSNQYPTLKTYKACNWCLHAHKPISRNSPKPLASCEKTSVDDCSDRTVKKKRNPNGKSIEKLHGSTSAELLEKRVTGDVAVEKSQMVLRKSKSANHMKNSGGIKTKKGSRHKVRRYRLLEEVISQ